MKASIIAKGCLPSGRVVWVHLDHPTLGKLGVLALYALNGQILRADMWHELADNLDNKMNWIVAGDFNNVEEAFDRRGGSGRILNRQELHAWRKFKRKFCLIDSFAPRPTHLKFS